MKECIDLQNEERMQNEKMYRYLEWRKDAEWKNVLIYRMKKGCRRKACIDIQNEERIQNERMYRYTEWRKDAEGKNV